MSLLWLQVWFLCIGITCTQEPCTTSKGNDGFCVHISVCPQLRAIAIRKQISAKEERLVRVHSCGKEKVCCHTIEKKHDLPDLHTCGLDNAGNRISMGHEADLGQYRWMVAIEHHMNNERKIVCGGSLVNTLLSLRLGEFDLQTNPDCDKDNNCIDPVLIVGVRQRIIHPNYNSITYQNDIALLKLEKSLPQNYTQYILPICLPTTKPLRERSFINNEVVVAGWGATENTNRSPKLRHVTLKVISLDVCNKPWITKTQLNEKHLCAMAADEKHGDTCEGDSGGPLMFSDNGNLYLIGIVSYGPKGCVKLSRPAVYVNVSNFMDWILEKLME